MADRHTYQLQHPITNGSETIAALQFRRPKAKDFRDLPVDPAAITMGHLLNVAGKLTGQPPHIIDHVEGEDIVEVLAITNGFLQSGRVTGPTPSA